MVDWVDVRYGGVEFCYDTIFGGFRVIRLDGLGITKRCRIQRHSCTKDRGKD